MCNFCRYVGLDSFFYFFCPTFVSISFYALFSIFASSYVTRGFLILNMTFLCHNFPQNNCSHIFLAPLHILELSPTSCIVMVSQLFLYSVYMKELLFLYFFSIILLLFHNLSWEYPFSFNFFLEVAHTFFYLMLQVGNDERIHVYYAHGQDNPTFVRRCYWLLDKYVWVKVLMDPQVNHAYLFSLLFGSDAKNDAISPFQYGIWQCFLMFSMNLESILFCFRTLEHIVLVHYRETQEVGLLDPINL